MRVDRFVRYAPKLAQFVVTALDENLPRARRLLFGAPLRATDGGPGGDLLVGVDEATPTAAGVVRLSGQLGGTAQSPDVRGLRVLDGGSPVLLALGQAADGSALVRDGGSVVGVPVVRRAGDTMTGDLGMAGHRVRGLVNGVLSDDAATYGQVTALLNGLDWQASVLDGIPTPPGNPATGDRYLVVATATGAWAGHEEKIAQWSGSGWTLVVPNKGFTLHNEATGQDLTYTGAHPAGSWVNIGASVDHASLLNLAAGDPHPQYQLAAGREQANGYAGLGSDTLPIRPSKGVRTGGDPTAPGPGEVWLVGTELKFRTDSGSPTTELVERQARRNAANGYAGLDGGGRVGPAQAPAKATYATGGDQALSPADIGAVPSGRTVATGTGLSGGGDLSANRTLAIAAFGGLVAKDHDPATASWSANEVKTLFTIDAGADGQLLVVGVRLPATVDVALRTEAVFELDNGAQVILENTSSSVTLDSEGPALGYVLMGNLANAAQNNGRGVRKVLFRGRNTTGNPVNNVDLGVFRLRAWCAPRGAGGAL